LRRAPLLSLKKSKVCQRGEMSRKATGVRGKLWTPRSALERSETARTLEGVVGEPPEALDDRT